MPTGPSPRDVSPSLTPARPALALAVVVGAVAVQFWPALVGRVYRFEDIGGYFEPLWTAAAAAMRDGRVPVWDGGAWSGQPLLGDPQLGAFYPPNWLWLALPVLRAYATVVALHALWGALGMYALARARGRSAHAAALGAVALGVGGYVVLQVRHVMFVEATAWVPWLVLCGWRFLDGRDRRWLAAMAASVGLCLLTGGVSMIYYAAWFAAAVLLPRAIAGDGGAPSASAAAATVGGEPRRPAGALAGLVGLAVGGVLGVALASVMLAPAGAHAALSPRARGTDYAFAASVAWRGLHFLPSLFVPNLLGQEVRGDYVGGGTQWEIAGYYAGMIPFALAVDTWLRGERRRRGERLGLLAICALAVLLAPGARSPIHRAAFELLPLYGSMRCPPRALYVFTFAVPLLAADALDRRFGGRPRVAWALVALTACDLLVTHRAENPSTTLAAARAAAVPPAADFLAGRAASDGDARFVNEVHAAHDLHNAGLLWRVDGASGYSSLPIARYLDYLWIANHGAPYPHARLHDDLSAQGLWRLDSPLVDALAVRWVVSARPPGPAHFVRRFDGQGGLDVYENPRALPRARLVHAALVVDGADASARAIADAAFDPRALAVLEETPAPAPAPLAPGAVEPAPRRLDRRTTPTEAAYAVELAAPGLLVLADPAYPTWSATVDGAPAPLLVADHALRAVALGAGRHEVVLRCASPALARGALVTLLALAATLGLWVSGLVRWRAARRAARTGSAAPTPGSTAAPPR